MDSFVGIDPFLEPAPKAQNSSVKSTCMNAHHACERTLISNFSAWRVIPHSLCSANVESCGSHACCWAINAVDF